MNSPVPWRIDWTEALSVGIPELDAEHQHLIGLANKFNMTDTSTDRDWIQLGVELREMLLRHLREEDIKFLGMKKAR